ncbi:cell wall-binding repeat-containing protein [Microbacterium sp.]|uniref:cell wall-binding repeat-containing protein n=1 Tax=Microbacterium sp. TaxID=51671 RepID=UPI0028121BFD|nr:cell wall-binding repeat-containing protein [Microbacterium sp.]
MALVLSALAPPAQAAHAQSVNAGTRPVTAVTQTPQRIAGTDRYDTAVRLSRTLDGPVPVVFLATGADFPDALTAAAAAGAAGGPLLLTRPTMLPDLVRAEIVRLAPQRIVVVGGSGVVAAGVERALRGIAPTTRIQGADRYETARRLSTAEFTAADEVLIVTGRDYPDALVAAAAAGGARVPVLLVNGRATTLPSGILQEIRRLGAERVSIVGGYGAVRPELQSVLAKAGLRVHRLAGANRYDTAAAVDDAYFPASSADRALIATGADFPDALAGAAAAARANQPLYLVRRTCADPATVASATRVGTTATLALGGAAVVSEASARLVSCTKAAPGSVLDQSWDELDTLFDPDAPAPYWDRPPVDVRASTQVLDTTGLRVYREKSTGLRADHPVVYAQYGISALLEYQRTGDALWLKRAERQAERLIEMRTLRGDAWWYSYPFNWTYSDRTLHAPWWSAMAQGQALSLFVRLSDVDPQPRWDAAIEGTWKSFLQSRSSSQQWSSVVIDGHLYLEEYAGDQKPLQVLNGQIFAMFGVYDYWRLTANVDAERLLRGASATVLDMMPKIRKPGDVSYYCVQASFCQRTLWQNQKYHVIHSWQLDTLQSLTGIEEFGHWADTLRADWRPVTLRMQNDTLADEVTLGGDPLDADPLDQGESSSGP